MHDGVGIHPVSLEDPIVATYLIQRYYNRSRKGMLDQKKICAKKITTAGYSVGYSPLVFLIILKASSMYLSQVHELCLDMAIWYCAWLWA